MAGDVPQGSSRVRLHLPSHPHLHNLWNQTLQICGSVQSSSVQPTPQQSRKLRPRSPFLRSPVSHYGSKPGFHATAMSTHVGYSVLLWGHILINPDSLRRVYWKCKRHKYQSHMKLEDNWRPLPVRLGLSSHSCLPRASLDTLSSYSASTGAVPAEKDFQI